MSCSPSRPQFGLHHSTIATTIAAKLSRPNLPHVRSCFKH
uniref:Bridging integrator 3 n=1 Tax=Mus musculus TaxID=10090 RepID=A0A2I3BR15_MOUSE